MYGKGRFANSNILLKGACLVGPWIGSILAYAITGSVTYAIATLVCATVVSWALVRYVLIDPYHAKQLTAATVVLAGLFSAATIVLSQSAILFQVSYSALRAVFPNLELPAPAADNLLPNVVVALCILAVSVTGAWLVLRGADATTRNLEKPTDLSSRQLATIRRTLKDHLDRLDEELKFFEFRNSPIDPLLEEINTTDRHVKIQSAEEVVASAEDFQFIVVKGEPGSGKSVMLRNLTRQLILAETNARIPLLLDLREWDVPEDNSHTNLLGSLDEWVKLKYWERTGARPQSQADEEFGQLYSEGGFVFLFDSFDENTAVSNAPHNSATIRKLSYALAEFIRRSGGCTGLVFSRDYKAPTAGWIDHAVYSVRPFSDSDVRRYIEQNAIDSANLRGAVFGNRSDLYAIAKTPLLLALLVDFCNRNSGALPVTEFEIFDGFIGGQIHRTWRALPDPKIKLSEINEVARSLARGNALIIPRRKNVSPPRTGVADTSSRMQAISVLREARLLKGQGDDLRFSHKRFQEYFRVLGMVEGHEQPPSLAPGHIDDNRDVLSLYAQICPAERGELLAAEAHRNLIYAYSEFTKMQDPKKYEAMVLSLRFLRRAFRNRPHVVDPYRRSIRTIVVELWNTFDVLTQKHAVENLSLLPPITAANLVRRSLEQRVGWLRRVALWQARYVSSLQPWLGRCVAAYSSKQDDVDCLLDRSRSNINSAMSNAAWVDRFAVAVDTGVRISLVAMIFLLVLIEVPVMGPATLLMLLTLYIGLTINTSDTASGADMEYLARGGFNSGLSGFVGFASVFAIFWNVVGAAIDPSKGYFWAHSGGWLIFVLLISCVVMMANNFLTRRRDQLDEFGEINPLSHRVFKVDRPTTQQMLDFGRRNWVFFVYGVLFIGASASAKMAWTLWAAAALWLLFAFGLVSWGWIAKLRQKLLARADRPKVIKFTRHFSGRRTEIAAALKLVRTDDARLDILIAAESRATEFAAILRSPTNTWPDGARPSFSAHVDGYLAILDERWWGLA